MVGVDDALGVGAAPPDADQLGLAEPEEGGVVLGEADGYVLDVAGAGVLGAAAGWDEPSPAVVGGA